MDSHPPYHVSVENSSVILTINFSDFHQDILPKVKVSAVDVCGQSSNASLGVVEGYSAIFHQNSVGEQQSTRTEQQFTNQPSTECHNGKFFAYCMLLASLESSNHLL